MRSIDDYLDAALNSTGLSSDRKLSKIIKCDPSAISGYRRGISLPKDQQMVAIAELADIDPDIALLELNFWRSAHREDIKSATIYRQLLTKLTGAAASIALFCLVFGFSAFTADRAQAADINPVYCIYYVKKICLVSTNTQVREPLLPSYTLSPRH